MPRNAMKQPVATASASPSAGLMNPPSTPSSTPSSLSSSSISPAANVPLESFDVATLKPRKKLSFKEPEIFGSLKAKKPSAKRNPLLKFTRSASLDVSCEESRCEEEEEKKKKKNGEKEEKEERTAKDELDELESQAMRVVRTVGQAFEVCHKLSLNNATEEKDTSDKEREKDYGENHRDVYDDQDEIPNEQPLQQTPSPVQKDVSLLGDTEDTVAEQTSVPCLLRSHDVPATTASTSPIRQSPSGTVTSDCGGSQQVGGELTALKHEIQLLRERLEQQSQQTRAAVAHARLLQDQLAAETAARVEAQTRTHQLLVQNKELLEHIGALVGHLREQERISGSHVSAQSQMPASATMQQTSTVPDLSSLGQCQRTGGQSSPWELDPPSFSYCSYPTDPLYPGNFNSMRIQGINNSTDQLHFQAQLLERLHNISPYQMQRSPYATPTPYAMDPNLLLPPNNRTPNSSQLSPSMSLRVSQANSFASSPVMNHKLDNNYVVGLDKMEAQQSAFIKPLPCVMDKIPIEVKSKQERVQIHDDIPPIILDPPPQGKSSEPMPKQTSKKQNSTVHGANDGSKNVQTSKSLATMLRTPGPPPSRTTSARLPPRNDLMNQMQRTMWARHTTK